MALTIPEATALLHPPITPAQLTVIVRALAIPPAGTRPTGRKGHPVNTYDWAVLCELHAALRPWLGEARGCRWVSPPVNERTS